MYKTGMQHYASYIAKNLAGAFLLIVFSLTSIVWLTQALRFIDYIVNRGVSFGSFVTLTLLLIPSLLLLLLPIAMFCAVLFTYHRFAADSELTVLSSAGLSPWQLAKPALAVASAVTVLCYAIALYGMPWANRQFKDMQAFLKDNYASLLLQEEVFNSPIDGLTVFMRERDKDGVLRGILVHDNRDAQAPVTMMAELGRLTQTDEGPQFMLYKGNRQEMRNGKISVLNFERYTLDLSFYTGGNAMRKREIEERYLGDLLRSNDGTPKEIARMRAEAHQRITWPLYAIGLTLLALYGILCGAFNRRGQWKRMGAISAIGAGVVILAIGLSDLAVNYPALFFIAYAQVLTLIGICLPLLSGRSARQAPPARKLSESPA